MQLPHRLDEILKTDRKLHAAVTLSIEEFWPWIKANKLPFFPDYTDHGPDHLQAVLNTAASLIRDEAFPYLSAPDVAALVLSVLLHDCAMHLTLDGFLRLIDPEAKRPLIPDFGDRAWPELWDAFYREARRWDGRTLRNILGNEDSVYRPSPDPLNWTERDRRLIGEFVRRHHPRLAHEIALWGVPGPNDRPLKLHTIETWLADLAGFIARSHGLPLRSCADRLRVKKRLVEYRKVHAVFLMALLRVADYIQVNADRAPKRMLRVQALRSPFSSGEWEAHAAIKDVSHHRGDPEGLLIDAEPDSVGNYLRVKEWLDGIQAELDASWATLGEAYGLHPNDLAHLGLVIRRVRSNIDEVDFASTVDYVPARIGFRVDPNVLKLLVSPLYDDKPEIGIRELLQNAVDAVRELWDCRGEPEPAVERGEYDWDVLITLETLPDGTGTLTVEDRGIGMTLETIREYFLTAGATYVMSNEWRELHEDETGHSRVARSGRFGVGVMAAFLLGDSIQVTTRHVDASDTEGYSFKLEADIDAVTVCRTACRSGTLILVRLNREITTKLSDNLPAWDWYCLTSPRVQRRILPSQHIVGQSVIFDAMEPIQVFSCTSGFPAVHWTYRGQQLSNVPPRLVCNGIRVDRRRRSGQLPEWTNRIDAKLFQFPCLSVMDPDCRLALNLRRDGLITRQVPFEERLAGEVARVFLAALLRDLPSDPAMAAEFLQSDFGRRYGWSNPMSQNGGRYIAQTFEGCLLLDPNMLKWAGVSRLVLTPGTSSLVPGSRYPKVPDSKIGQIGNAFSPLFLRVGHEITELRSTAREAWIFKCFRAQVLRRSITQSLSGWKSEPNDSIPELGTASIQLFIGRDLTGLLSASDWSSGCTVREINGGSVFTPREYPVCVPEIALLPEAIEPSACFGEWILTEEQETWSNYSLGRVWTEVIGQPVIPFDLLERRRQLASAYRELAPYMKSHE